MFWNFFEHLLLHELDGNDSVLTEMVALEDHSVVALSQGPGPVDVEVIGDLLHPLHLFSTNI